MRVFDHPNLAGFLCPICKTVADKPVVLVKKAGTGKDGIMEAEQIHLDCLDPELVSVRGRIFLFQEL